jgi:hypothetical protein
VPLHWYCLPMIRVSHIMPLNTIANALTQALHSKQIEHSMLPTEILLV